MKTKFGLFFVAVFVVIYFAYQQMRLRKTNACMGSVAAKHICQKAKGLNNSRFLKSKSPALQFEVDGTSFYQRAEKIFHSGKFNKNLYESAREQVIWEIAGVLFIKDRLASLDHTILKGNKIAIYFYSTIKSKYQLTAVLNIDAANLAAINKELKTDLQSTFDDGKIPFFFRFNLKELAHQNRPLKSN